MATMCVRVPDAECVGSVAGMHGPTGSLPSSSRACGAGTDICRSSMPMRREVRVMESFSALGSTLPRSALWHRGLVVYVNVVSRTRAWLVRSYVRASLYTSSDTLDRPSVARWIAAARSRPARIAGCHSPSRSAAAIPARPNMTFDRGITGEIGVVRLRHCCSLHCSWTEFVRLFFFE